MDLSILPINMKILLIIIEFPAMCLVLVISLSRHWKELKKSVKQKEETNAMFMKFFSEMMKDLNTFSPASLTTFGAAIWAILIYIIFF